LVDYGAVPTSRPARFHEPPFKPCVPFSGTRLNDDLLDVACMRSRIRHDSAIHRTVTPIVPTFAESCWGGSHLAHTDSRTKESSRFFSRGCWPFPACPHAYLLADVTKAGSLPSGALSCAPSLVVWTPRTPSWLRATSAIRPYMPGLCPTRLPGRASPVTRCSVPTCHRLRPRGGPAFLPA